jgi:ElaB/YqjD/DUF883 family membrane-anchored ribosome-binding protein
LPYGAEDLLEATASQGGEQIARVRTRADPWTAVGVAAGVGVLIGLLLGRR